MDRIFESARVSPSEIAHIGVAVHSDGAHIGVLHRSSKNTSALLLHLAWHNRLRSDIPTAEYLLWVEPLIPEARGAAIAALCRRIWKQHKKNGLPFGLSRPNDFFDVKGGVLKGPAKVGLTCATFVLAVFDAAKIPLVRSEDWPDPTETDIARQREFARRLEDDPSVPREHVRAFREEIGNIRYGPLEVAGAAASDSLPADYAVALSFATRIKRRLADLIIEKNRGEEKSS